MHAHLSTFVFQAINFVVLAFVLQRWLYRPVQAAIARRQHEVDAPLEAAAADRQAAADLRAAAEALQVEARGARERLLADAEKTAESRRDELLAEGRRAAADAAAKAQADLEEQRVAAEAALRLRAAEVAVALAGRLLARAACQPATDRLLEEALAAVEAIGLRPQRGAAQVRVVTAAPLDDDRQAAVADRLRRAIGGEVSVAFAQDQALIAGAEIQLPSAVIRQSWRDQLADARTALS